MTGLFYRYDRMWGVRLGPDANREGGRKESKRQVDYNRMGSIEREIDR